jgi:hypothetical protein
MPEPGPHRLRRRSEVRRLTEQLNVRCTPAGKAAVIAAAQELDMDVPDLIRMCLEKQGIRIADNDFDLPRAHAG